MDSEFLEAAHKGIPLSDYRAERLAALEAENERLKAAIESLLADEHWRDYMEGNRADYHICWFCGGKMSYGFDVPPIEEFPHAPNCVALVAYKLIQGE